jgi:hypothetical protein
MVNPHDTLIKNAAKNSRITLLYFEFTDASKCKKYDRKHKLSSFNPAQSPHVFKALGFFSGSECRPMMSVLALDMNGRNE